MLVIILLKDAVYQDVTLYGPVVASILEGTAASIFRVEELFDPEGGQIHNYLPDYMVSHSRRQ
jgi:hypothetical protein